MRTGNLATFFRPLALALALAPALCACQGDEVEAAEEDRPVFLRPDAEPAAPVAAGEAHAQQAPAAAAREQAQARPGQAAEPVSAPPSPRPAEPVGEKAAAQLQPSRGAAPAEGSRGTSDAALAALLLHGPRQELPRALEREGATAERARMLEGFVAALEGRTEAEAIADLETSRELSGRERDLLRRALSGAPVPAEPVSGESPLECAMRLALLERDAQAEQGAEPARAARAWSQLLLAEVRAPWPADRAALARWTAALKEAQERHRWSRTGAWPALEVEVRPGDSLIAIRKRVLAEHPELLLCTGLVARANDLPDERAIRPGDVLRVPTDRASALVDVDARWTFYLLDGEVADAWEVGVGRDESATPPGRYTVGQKQKEPMWFAEGRPPVPYGDPENPLGTRWLAWHQAGRPTSLGFHGTSDPGGVGGRVSQGCVRMRNEDVERLFDILPEGAEVVVQP